MTWTSELLYVVASTPPPPSRPLIALLFLLYSIWGCLETSTVSVNNYSSISKIFSVPAKERHVQILCLSLTNAVCPELANGIQLLKKLCSPKSSLAQESSPQDTLLETMRNLLDGSRIRIRRVVCGGYSH